MTYGSVCSGIEAATAAWEPLGWKPLWFSEIDPFPKAVLAHHYPSVPDLGDMCLLPSRVLSGEVPAPDVLVGGTPCQSFSVAGLRKGLADPRGLLAQTFVELLDAIDTVRAEQGKPAALALWENVPGVLSDKGNAFGNFLSALVGEDIALLPAGKRWTDAGGTAGPKRTAAWRVLDAQYFGLAQRRRRLFLVVGARASGINPFEVLFVEEGVRRDLAPSRGEGKARSRDAGSSAESHRGPGVDPVCFEAPAIGVFKQSDVAGVMLKHTGMGSGETQNPAFVLYPSEPVSFRRLTPVECERIQGFPDDYTRVPWARKTAELCPDGPRYKALGNSMPVPIIAWIGKKIERVRHRSASGRDVMVSSENIKRSHV